MIKNSLKVKKYFSLSKIKEKEWYLLVLSLILCLLIIWAGFIAFKGEAFNLRNILSIHTSPLVWFVNLLVLSIPTSVIYFFNYFNIHRQKLINQVRELQQNNIYNIEIAEKIRNGELDEMNVESIGKLSDTLLNLGTSLKTSREKEDNENWVTQGKELISDILRSHQKVTDLAVDVIRGIIEYTGAIQGSLFLLEDNHLKNIATYAYNRRRYERQTIPVGKGLIGAVAYEKEMIYRTEIPEEYYTITSGLLGEQKPKSIIIIPISQEEELQGVMEIAFIKNAIPKHVISFVEELGGIIGRTIYNLKINQKTEELLAESQQMTVTLKENEKQLQANAVEMMEAQEELEKSNKLLETQIQEVEHAQQRLEALLTNASEFISIYDENQRLVFESPSVKRILGYNDEDDVVGMDTDLLTPKGYKTINNLFQFLLETPGGVQTAQYTYLKKNGKKMFLETKGTNLLHDPAIKGIIFNTQDITERKRAEKEERMKSKMQSLSENSPDMIIRINTNGKLVYVNPRVSEFIGTPTDEIIKNRITDLEIDQRFIDYVLESLSKIRDEQIQIISEVEVTSGEENRVMEIKAIPEFSEEKELESILFVAHDMTELKKIEAEIKEKNKKISDSINYAQRIQTAILPDTKILQRYFPRSFMFYRPKDVVSGDFPWLIKKDNYFYIAAVDCTGHGVPGALLSFIGFFLLNNIINASDDLTAAEVLDNLHLDVRRTLRQDQEGANGRDGMDLALVKIDLESNELQYSGAHNPLYYLTEGEFIEYKGSRKGIGGIPLAKKKEKDFENHVIKYKKGDKFFIFSDGYPDQVGGENGRKYQSKRMRELIERDATESMAHHAQEFSNQFYEWMGEFKQVDDVLLIGIEL